MLRDADYLRVEVRLRQAVVAVRQVGQEGVSLWRELTTGQTDATTGWTYAELRALGNGKHTIKRLPV